MSAQRNIEIVRGFLNKIGAMDINGAGEYLAEDAKMMFPYLEGLELVRGKDAIVQQISNTVPHFFERMDFTYDEWYPIQDPDVLIAEYRSVCPRLDKKGNYENIYVGIFRLKNEKITQYKEYLNPLKLNFDY